MVLTATYSCPVFEGCLINSSSEGGSVGNMVHLAPEAPLSNGPLVPRFHGLRPVVMVRFPLLGLTTTARS